MKVKHLLEKINKALDDGEITLDTPLIAWGTYGGYGADIPNIYIAKDMVRVDDEANSSTPQTAIKVGIETYIYEAEDFGTLDMWMSENDYKEFMEIQL